MRTADRNLLVEAHMAMVPKIVQRLRIDPNFADDCKQAGYMAIMQAIETWEPEKHGALEYWLRISITRDVLRERDRLRSGGESLEDLVESESSDLPATPREWIEDIYLRERLTDRIMNLKNSQAKLLLLHVLAGLTVSAAGEEMGMTQSAADRLYQRTLDLLRAG